MVLSGIDFSLLTKIETSLKKYRHSTVNEFQRKASKVVTEEYSSISMIEMITLVGDGYLKIQTIASIRNWSHKYTSVRNVVSHFSFLMQEKYLSTFSSCNYEY